MPRRPIVRKHVASPAPAAPKAEQAPQISVTRGAGVLKFDPERPQGSFLVLSDSGTVLGRGFYGAGRLYVHFQEPETRKPGEWIFADAKQAGTNMMVLSSPLLGNEPAVMSIIGEAAEPDLSRVTAESDGNTAAISYRPRDLGESHVIFTADSEAYGKEPLDLVPVAIESYGAFDVVTFSVRERDEMFPMNDDLYSVVVDSRTGKALGESLRASFHSMSMRFDSYLETGQSFGPMGDMDWWPVFYADKWSATLKNVRMPDWDFEDDRCVTVTQNGETQRFVLP